MKDMGYDENIQMERIITSPWTGLDLLNQSEYFRRRFASVSPYWAAVYSFRIGLLLDDFTKSLDLGPGVSLRVLE